jgi:hypothetical protein
MRASFIEEGMNFMHVKVSYMEPTLLNIKVG